MRFAICNEIFSGWPFERVLRFVRETGYAALEIAPFTLAPSVTLLSPADRLRLVAASEQEGVNIAGLHWVLAQTEGYHLNHPDPLIRRHTASYLVELVHCCADLEGDVVVVGSPKQRNRLTGVTPEQAWDWAAETFQPAVRQAEDRGVTLCLEPLSPAETNFINTAADAIRFIEPFRSPRFQIILDVKAMSSEERAIPDIIRQSWPHVAHFHANDANLKGPGFGQVDFVPIAQALREVGYTGYVSVEVFKFEEGPEAIATRSLECLRQAFGLSRPG